MGNIFTIMTDVMHVHKILELLSVRDCSIDELKKEFGSEVKFANCKGMEFSFDSVIPFLLGKNKIIIKDDIISLNRDIPMCNH